MYSQTEEEKRKKMDMTTGAVLLEDFIATIISLTSSPRDACRYSLASRLFRLAAGSDLVWKRFLPPDYQQIISESVSSGSSSSSSLNNLSKKDLYFHLCDNPILIGNGNRSFAIDKLSGKKCYMLGSRELSLGDTRGSWKWISSAMLPVRHLPQSRFWEVVHLVHVCVLEIEGRIKTEILSPNTKYGAYFVYDLLKNHSSGLPPGYDLLPVNLSIKFENENKDKAINSIYLLPKQEQSGQGARRREDKWLEIEIGEFFNGEVDNVVVIRLSERQALNMKYGLVVHGIELRPKL